MDYKVRFEKPPFRAKISAALKAMGVADQCLLFELKQRPSVAVSMNRIKKTKGVEFISEVEGNVLKVWRVK